MVVKSGLIYLCHWLLAEVLSIPGYPYQKKAFSKLPAIKAFRDPFKQISSLFLDGFCYGQSVTEPVYSQLASEGHYLMRFPLKFPSIPFRSVIGGRNTGIPQEQYILLR
jgi:hypothetical protein